MTQKELSYVEDACSHESSIIKILEDTKNKLDDQELVSYIEREINKHNDLKERLINLLEEKANG